LPGEKTSITIKSYRDSETTRKEAQSLVEGYTQEGATELERTAQEEQGFSSESSVDTSNAATKNESPQN